MISRLIVRKTERINRNRSKPTLRRKVKYLEMFRQAVTAVTIGFMSSCKYTGAFFPFSLVLVNVMQHLQSIATLHYLKGQSQLTLIHELQYESLLLGCFPLNLSVDYL